MKWGVFRFLGIETILPVLAVLVGYYAREYNKATKIAKAAERRRSSIKRQHDAVFAYYAQRFVAKEVVDEETERIVSLKYYVAANRKVKL